MPNNVIRTEKEAKIQNMLDNYNKITSIGVMDFSDYYDSRMDGIDEKDLQQSKELNDYVDQLLSFQKEEDANELEDEEKELFDKLKRNLISESKETGVHKLLQFKLMNELLDTEGNLESEHLENAANCQNLYDKITSFDILESQAKQRSMQDDGSFNKSPKKIAEEILEREKTQVNQPLQKICEGMLKDFDGYKNILKAPALMPYQTLIDETIKEKQKAEQEKNLSPKEREIKLLDQEIKKTHAKQEKLQEELDKIRERFDEDYKSARGRGIHLSVPSKKNPEKRVMISTAAFRKMQTEEKAALNEIFHDTTDDFVQRVDTIKTTDKGSSSDEFRNMMESLTMLRNHQDTLRNMGDTKKSYNRELIDTVVKVYKDTKKYVKKREKDGFFSRHIGQGATRYKQAKEVMNLLETYRDAVQELELHRTKNVLLQRMEHMDELYKQIKAAGKETSQLKVKRDELRDEKKQKENPGKKENKKSADSRQRLENGFKDLNNPEKSDPKNSVDPKKTEPKVKAQTNVLSNAPKVNSK